MALIYRQRPCGDQYSLPGGLVHADEEVPAALARELDGQAPITIREANQVRAVLRFSDPAQAVAARYANYM